MEDSIYEDNKGQWTPARLRQEIRSGMMSGPTAGYCDGYAQANLVILPQKYAYDFLLFAQRNPRSCPLLEVTDVGSGSLNYLANDADIYTDLPKYRVYENGSLTGEFAEATHLRRSDLVGFLIGCSFSFEAELIEAGVPVRHIEEGKNVPMYLTKVACKEAGIFSGNMVVSMRPIPYEKLSTCVSVTAGMSRVHGAPLFIGDPEKIGIKDINKPDFGDSVTIHPGEVPVFWACGVTPQAVLMKSCPDFAITHAPGHMFVSDVKNVALKYEY